MNFPYQPQMSQHEFKQHYHQDQNNREYGGFGFGYGPGYGYGGYYPPRPRCRWVRECRWVRRCDDYSPYGYDYNGY